MSEYYMSHTGAELDDAINKFQSGYIKPSGTKNITANGTYDVAANALASINVPLEHYAFGYKNCTANDSFTVSGITDQSGRSFTPKGYAFMLAPNITANTNYNNSTNGLIYCLYDIVNNRMYRTVLYNGTYTVRVNPGVSSGTVASGSFSQAASSNKLYNVLGQRYFWVCWG